MKFLSTIKRKFRFSSTFKVIGLLSALHFAFIIIIDKVTALAPDEANYIGVFNNLYKRNFSLDGYLGWQEGSINALRIIYLPAKILEVIGFSDFYSVRLQALLYTLSSVYLLFKNSKDINILKLDSKKWILFSLLIPSVFVWRTLGLRESFIFFFLIAVFVNLKKYLISFSNSNLIAILLACAGVLITKNYLYVLLIFSLSIASTYLRLRKEIESVTIFKILSASLIPLLIFPTLALNTFSSTNLVSVDRVSISARCISTSGNLVESRGQTLHDLNRQLKNNAIIFWISEKSGLIEKINQASNLAIISKDSAAALESCAKLGTKPASLRDPIGLGKSIVNFLFIPVPFLDNGSFFLNLQSYESFAWYLIYLIFLVMIWRTILREYEQSLTLLSATFFALGFVLLSALVEINDGTSVRHRSVFLVSVLIMISSLKQQKNLPLNSGGN